MFQVNDTVMYGNTGVCRIVDIRQEKFAGRTAQYYILKPVDDASTTIHCPTENAQAKIRKLLSPEEVYALIQIMPDMQAEWIESEQQRKEAFNNILKRGDHVELVKLIKALHFKRAEKLQAGRKFYAADEKVMKDAERMLHGELAYVLKIAPEEVVPFIMGELQDVDAAQA
nr:CarD family transcriptional regulator [Maliibacterium massiliense]